MVGWHELDLPAALLYDLEKKICSSSLIPGIPKVRINPEGLTFCAMDPGGSVGSGDLVPSKIMQSVSDKDDRELVPAQKGLTKVLI